MKQFVLPPEDEYAEVVTLTGREYHYLCVVRRYGEGDLIPARTARGVPKTLILTEIGKEYCLGRLTEASPDRQPEGHGSDGAQAAPGEPRIVLCQATLKGKKLDQVVRQATEAGVHRVVPVVTRHAVSDPVAAGRGAKKVERWRIIAKEAVQQSGRPTVPRVDEPRELEELLPFFPDPPGGLSMFFHESAAEAEPLHKTLLPKGEPPEEIWIIVGPEGGLSEDEVAKLRRAGCVAGYLGPQVLRSETAALYAVAAVKTVVREVETWALRESRDAR